MCERESVLTRKKTLEPGEPKKKVIKVSRTVTEAGYIYRTRKPEGFFWLTHRTVDAKYNFLVDAYATPGNVHDSTVYLERLDYILHHFAFPFEVVAIYLDYFSTEIAKSLVNCGIYSVISRRRFGGKKG